MKKKQRGMKKNITFFLGAGASNAFGLPTTSQVFPRFWKKLWKGSILREHQRDLLLNKFFKTIYPGLTSQTEDKHLPGITDVLSLLDNFINNHTIPLKMLSYYELLDCRHALEVGIVSIIEKDFFEYDPSDPVDILSDNFVKHLKALSPKYKVNIITTNYDILVDYGIFKNIYGRRFSEFVKSVDFGIRWRDPFKDMMYNPPADPAFSILKLHGSTNWLTCDLCNQVYINPYGPIHDLINLKTIDDRNTCHCGHGRLSSVIVSPSLERVINNANLKYIWNCALEALRVSEKWVIAGYSLPAEDLNIRSILTRAFEGRQRKPQVTIVQKGCDAEPRFKSIFGPIKFIGGGMEEYVAAAMKK
jgi:NAD-dependent SIR2 family protein deacetylase